MPTPVTAPAFPAPFSGCRGTDGKQRDGEAKARRLLQFVGIPSAAEESARNLPYGDQRRLEIARALATEPRLLLLDEPAAGMNPAEKHNLGQLVRSVRDSGVTVLMIEHDMGLVMTICDRIAVLDFGRKIAEGIPSAVRQSQAVIDAYLGRPDTGTEVGGEAGDGAA